MVASSISIREVLENPEEYSGWFYLPSKPWMENTEGFFLPYSKDGYVQKSIENEKGIFYLTIDSDAIEDVCLNLEDQLPKNTHEDRFNAFKFYCENDAFIIIS